MPREKAPRSDWSENARTLVAGVVLFLILRVVIIQPFTIPSASMEPGLTRGDYIIVSKWDYGWSRYSIPFSPPLFEGRLFDRRPQRGDVVVFRVPTDRNRDYIKRVIGLPGDRVQVQAGVVHLNGQPLAQADIGRAEEGFPGWRRRETQPGGRSYVTLDLGGLLADNTDVFVVPEGSYFVMGDNRDNSLDSRFSTAVGGVGFVREEHLIGRARFILASWDEASIFKPWTWFTRADTDRFFRTVR